MNKAEQVKEIATKCGADLCGIASVDRFGEAPAGFGPLDIYPGTKSVISFAKRYPVATINATSRVPYSAVTVVLLQKLDLMSIDITSELQKIGINSVFIPSDDPYEYWDEENKVGRAIFSHKHAAELAGLGRIGRNTLLVNKQYGNMFMLSSILTDAELEPDDLITEEYCREGCNLCIDNCPGNALTEYRMTQKSCRPLSLVKNEKGFDLKGCFVCRQICPNYLGEDGKGGGGLKAK